MDYPTDATSESGGKPLLVTPDKDNCDMMNQIVWSLMKIIESQSMTGLPFDPANPATYVILKNAIQAMINATTNALAAKLVGYGGVVWFPARAIINAEYTPADGQLVTRTSCPSLVALLSNLPLVADSAWVATAANRASYSNGDGSTTIRLSDYNGKYGTDKALFLRGDGGNAAAVGAIQGDAIRNITGQVGQWDDFTMNGSYATNGAFARNAGSSFRGIGSGGGDGSWKIDFDSSRVVPTAGENRPNNVAGVFAIRTGGATAYSPPP